MNRLPFEVHPAAEIFPMMAGDAFEEFVADVEKNGVREQIVMWKGKLLDGRNRSMACLRLGWNPLDYACDIDADSIDPIEYVLSANLHRRHLTTAQRGKIGLAVLELYETEAKERQRATQPKKGESVKSQVREKLPEPNKGKAVDKAAAAVGISGRTLADTKKVYSSGNAEVIKAVDEGKLSISKAAKEVAPPKPKKEKPVSKPKETAAAVNLATSVRKQLPEWVAAFGRSETKANDLRIWFDRLADEHKTLLREWLA